MPLIIVSVSRLSVEIFSRQDIREKRYWTQNVCLDLSYNFESFLILRRIQRDIITDVHRSSCKKKVNQFHYRPEVHRGFQEVKFPIFHDNGPG